MPDDQQKERFREAVDEKNEAAKAASEQPDQQPTPADGIDGDRPELTDPERPQGETDQRAKNSRHGQVTADKWNQ
jgi:hypothetical protein